MYDVNGTDGLELVHTFEEKHAAWVEAVTVTRDGRHIISGSDDTTVKVWSVADKSLLRTCTGHTGSVEAVATTPSGEHILSGASRPHLPSVAAPRRHPRAHLRAAQQLGSALVALPDNQHALFSDSGDNTVKLFNFTDGTVKTSTSTHTGPVRCLALLPGGLRFVSGSADGTTRITQLGSASEAPVGVRRGCLRRSSSRGRGRCRSGSSRKPASERRARLGT